MVDGKIFSDALNEVGDKYILEAIRYRAAGKRRALKVLTAAACLCLFFVGGIHTMLRFDHIRAGCSAYPGDIVEGIYYYHVQHDGIYAYTPGKGTEKLLSTFWYDGFQVNDYGIYYTDGRRLYVREHETGERRRLYWTNIFNSSHIGFTIKPDGNLIVRVYNKYKEELWEVLIDGKTGEVLETVMEITSYDADVENYSDTHFWVGNREIVLVGEEYSFDLQENGVSILPEGEAVSKYSCQYIGNNLWFQIRRDSEEYIGGQLLFVVRPDGRDEIKYLPNNYGLVCGNSDYLFWTVSGDNSMWCMEVESGESWRLQVDTDMTIYDFETDGEYLYSCVPWHDYQAKWKLVYNEAGRPVEMRLLDENIKE